MDSRSGALLLRRYADTIDPGELHDSEAAVLEAVDYDYERAGARVLGIHIRQMAAPGTVGKLLSHLQSERTRDRLTIEMARALRGSEDPVELSNQLLRDFITGLSPP